MKTHILSEEKYFVSSVEKFNRMNAHLLSHEGHEMNHAQLEDYLHTEGLELLRQMYQDHLTLKSYREIPAQGVIGSDKIKRSQSRPHQRNLETRFGTVIVTRLGYTKAGHSGVHPIDAELNLPVEKYSHPLQKLVSKEAASRSFDEVVETLETYTHGHVPKRQAEELVIKATQDFDAFYQQPLYSQEMKEKLLILTVDAKGIVMRKEALREVTRRAAEQAKSKLSKRISKGEKKYRKRLAMVASVYSVAPHYRTPSQITKRFHPHNESDNQSPKPVGKRVWASVEKDMNTVISEMFDEAQAQDPHQEKEWVALVDGNRSQIKQIKAQAKKRQLKVTIILDIIHVLEYIWKAAYSFYCEGSQEAQAFVSDKLFQILQGKSSLMAATMRRKATQLKLSSQKRKSVDQCANYLLNRKIELNYQAYLSKGYPIATGVIEGACRYLVKDRMDRTGARWSLSGAEAVLKVRSLMASHDFDAYFDFHQEQEYQRNHTGIMKVFLLPKGAENELKPNHLHKEAA